MDSALDREALLREPWAEHADKERLRNVSEKQFRYVRNYLSSAVGGTKKEAAIAAGYSPGGATNAAWRASKSEPGQIIADYRSDVLFDIKQERMKHLNKMAELRDEARENGKYGPAITAEKCRGQVLGLYNIKDEVDETKAKLDVSIAIAKLQSMYDRAPAGSSTQNVVSGLIAALHNRAGGSSVILEHDDSPMPSQD